MAINARAPKKVLEAICRKKMKLMRKLRKTKQRAEKIMEQEGVAEYHKMKEVNKVYAKEFR
jgi:flagellar biosynthesis/type III secretory pathway chaperone